MALIRRRRRSSIGSRRTTRRAIRKPRSRPRQASWRGFL
jgi:hypothetical protein